MKIKKTEPLKVERYLAAIDPAELGPGKHPRAALHLHWSKISRSARFYLDMPHQELTATDKVEALNRFLYDCAELVEFYEELPRSGLKTHLAAPSSCQGE
jgi:hypothetical protein